MKNFLIVSSILEEMLKAEGLTPPTRETLKNWRKGRIAQNKTKSGVKKYPVKPKLILNEDFIEIKGGRNTVRYSEAGYNKILELTKNLPTNKNQLLT